MIEGVRIYGNKIATHTHLDRVQRQQIALKPSITSMGRFDGAKRRMEGIRLVDEREGNNNNRDVIQKASYRLEGHTRWARRKSNTSIAN